MDNTDINMTDCYRRAIAVKNVVVVNDFGFVNGGASQVAINTALGLAKLEYKVYYFCAVLPIDKRISSNNRIQVVCTRQDDILSAKGRLKASFQGLWNRRSSAQFKKLLSSFSPDETIIHIHGWTKALSHSVIQVARQMKFPIIVTLHDYFIACPNGGFYNYQKQEICKLQALSLGCICSNCDSRSYYHKLWRVVRGTIQRFLLQIPCRLNYFISVSNFSTKILRPYLSLSSLVFLQSSSIETINDGRTTAEKNSKFIAVGRISPEKGFDLLAQAAEELNVELEIVGSGEKLDFLRRAYPKVNFIGWLDKDHLHQKIKEARALIFPSKWYETQGLVVLEAASHGVPAVVSDGTAAKELIQNHITGVLFNRNDLMDLKAKMQLILQSDTLVSHLSENAYRSFWSTFQSLDDYNRSIVSIYNQVILDCRKRKC